MLKKWLYLRKSAVLLPEDTDNQLFKQLCFQLLYFKFMFQVLIFVSSFKNYASYNKKAYDQDYNNTCNKNFFLKSCLLDLLIFKF